SEEDLIVLREHKEEIKRILPTYRFECPSSYGQQALWFIQRSAPRTTTYNIGFAARVTSEVSVPALWSAVQRLIRRHTILRTTFREVDGTPMQVTHAHREAEVTVVDAAGWSETALQRAVQDVHDTPFCLESGPLLRVHLFRRA